MAKLNNIFLLSSFSMMIISSLIQPLAAYSESKVTKIHFYLLNTFNASQPLKYGDVFAFQDPLTVGPDPNSTSLGRAQGIFGFPAHDASYDFHFSVTFIFTSGTYNGSTVVAVGRYDNGQSVRQLPIVGGTGHFELARGTVTSTTYSQTPPIFEYDLKIFHQNEIIEMKYV